MIVNTYPSNAPFSSANRKKLFSEKNPSTSSSFGSFSELEVPREALQKKEDLQKIQLHIEQVYGAGPSSPFMERQKSSDALSAYMTQHIGTASKDEREYLNNYFSMYVV